jgi:hypothetical protein
VSEELATITRAAATALLEGHEVEMQPVVLPPALPEPSRAPPAAPPPQAPAAALKRIHAGAGYVGTTFSADAPWQSGVDVGASLLATRSVYVGAEYAFFLPVDVQAEQASARIARHPLALVGGVELPLGADSVVGRAEIAGSADWTTRTTASTAPGFAATSGTTDIAYGIGARAKVAFTLWSAFELSLGFGGDWIVRPIVYAVSTPEPVEIARPYTVRARVDAGIAVHLW